MGRKILKWIGIILGSIVGLILLAVGLLYWTSSRKLNQQFDYQVERAVYVKGDSTSLARGKHIVSALAMCIECHGADFGGAKIIDSPAFAVVYGPNLTRGQGGLGVGGNYTIEDFDRAVRHGITKDNRGMIIMPSNHYVYMSDDDLSAVYAYIASLPPVDREVPPFKAGPIARMLLATGKLPPIPAEVVQHGAPRPPKPAEGPTKEYGQYLARLSCIGCHRPDLSGGVIEDGDPNWPPATNITKGGVIASYTYEDFVRLMRDGLRPGGNPVSEVMPVRFTKHMTDDELQALWQYMQSLPATPTGTASWFTHKTP